MSQPPCTEKRTTRSGKSLDKSVNDIFKTPLKDNEKAPSSVTTKSISHSTSSDKGNICKICQNSIKLRNSLLENNVDSLIDKLNAASEIFSNSMSQIESLIHEKYSVDNVNHINSIHVTKFLGQSSHREQQTDYSSYLSPDSDIYDVFLAILLQLHSSTSALMKNLNIKFAITASTPHQLNPTIIGHTVSIAHHHQIAQ